VWDLDSGNEAVNRPCDFAIFNFGCGFYGKSYTSMLPAQPYKLLTL